VFVLPITGEKKLVLIKNFRIPIEQNCIELPAGQRDETDPSELNVAQRELFEETGYIAETYISFPPFPYRSGSSDIICTGFIAINLVKTDRIVFGDGTEDIEVLEIPSTEFPDFYRRESQHTFFEPEVLTFIKIAEILNFL
jgi:ADP-ribose pyrophosphatase